MKAVFDIKNLKDCDDAIKILALVREIYLK